MLFDIWLFVPTVGATIVLEQLLCAHLGAHRYLQSEPRNRSFKQSNGFSLVHWRVHSNRFATVS